MVAQRFSGAAAVNIRQSVRCCAQKKLKMIQIKINYAPVRLALATFSFIFYFLLGQPVTTTQFALIKTTNGPITHTNYLSFNFRTRRSWINQVLCRINRCKPLIRDLNPCLSRAHVYAIVFLNGILGPKCMVQLRITLTCDGRNSTETTQWMLRTRFYTLALCLPFPFYRSRVHTHTHIDRRRAHIDARRFTAYKSISTEWRSERPKE